MLHEAAPCTCGLLYGSCGGGCSLLFAGDHHHHHYYKQCGDGEAYGSGSVDCTLSLGTPSTRRAEAVGAPPAAGAMHWGDQACNNANGGVGRQQESAAAPSARRCANCDTTSTPLWRNGPRGPKVIN